MNKFYSLVLAAIVGHGLSAQTIIYQENFEGTPVTSILNTWNSETTLTAGPSPCALASQGNASDDFNSTSIDFLSGQNSSYFLGANPEDPCGGFFNALVSTDTLDYSVVNDSIVFSCMYFISNTLGWGPHQLDVTFDNLSTTFLISTEFTTIGAWDSLSVTLPSSMMSPNVFMTIGLGGGEGVGVDDIMVVGYDSVSVGVIENPVPEIKVYPNPAANALKFDVPAEHQGQAFILDLSGRIVRSFSATSGVNVLDISDLANGRYVLRTQNNKKSGFVVAR